MNRTGTTQVSNNESNQTHQVPTEPGWYPDPKDDFWQEYFDGTTFTGQRRMRPAQWGAAAPVPPMESAPPQLQTSTQSATAVAAARSGTSTVTKPAPAEPQDHNSPARPLGFRSPTEPSDARWAQWAVLRESHFTLGLDELGTETAFSMWRCTPIGAGKHTWRQSAAAPAHASLATMIQTWRWHRIVLSAYLVVLAVVAVLLNTLPYYPGTRYLALVALLAAPLTAAYVLQMRWWMAWLALQSRIRPNTVWLPMVFHVPVLGLWLLGRHIANTMQDLANSVEWPYLKAQFLEQRQAVRSLSWFAAVSAGAAVGTYWLWVHPESGPLMRNLLFLVCAAASALVIWLTSQLMQHVLVGCALRYGQLPEPPTTYVGDDVYRWAELTHTWPVPSTEKTAP